MRHFKLIFKHCALNIMGGNLYWSGVKITPEDPRLFPVNVELPTQKR